MSDDKKSSGNPAEAGKTGTVNSFSGIIQDAIELSMEISLDTDVTDVDREYHRRHAKHLEDLLKYARYKVTEQIKSNKVSEEFYNGVEFVQSVDDEKINKLRTALKPFARFGDHYSKGRQVDSNHKVNLSWRFEDFAHASKVYKETE